MITKIIRGHARVCGIEVQINSQPGVVVDGIVDDVITHPAINPHSRPRVEGDVIGLSDPANKDSSESTICYDYAGYAITQGVGSTRIRTNVVVSYGDIGAPQNQNAGADIARDDVARSGRCPTNQIPPNGDADVHAEDDHAIQAIAQSGRAVDIGADVVAQNLSVERTAVLDRNAEVVVAGDDVARPSIPNPVVVRVLDQHAIFIVAQGVGAREISADEVAQHLVVRRPVLDRHAVAPVAGDNVAGAGHPDGGRRPADDVIA